jgi:O-antigen/teichoic acid export membrane protein
MEKMKYITILNVIAKAIFTILIFVLIKKPSDYIFQPILIAAGYYVSGFASVYIIFNHFGIKKYTPSFMEIKRAIKDSFDIFLNTLLPNLYNSFSTLLLGYWWGNAAVGILDAGKKVIALAEQAILVLSRTFYPYLANNITKHRVFFIISLSTSISFMFVFFFGADLIVNILFAKGFEGAKLIIRIMSVSPVLYSVMNSFGSNYLILMHKEKLLRNITMVSSIIGFISAFILIYYYKEIGAALTLILARGLIGGLSYTYSRKTRLGLIN